MPGTGKIEAAKLSYNSDKPVTEIAESLGVSESSLNRRRRKQRADPDQAFSGNGHMKERDEEIAQLKKGLKQGITVRFALLLCNDYNKSLFLRTIDSLHN